MRLRLAPLIPYAAVAMGLYWLRSAWAAILLYHAGAAAVSLLHRSRRALPAAKPSPLLYLSTAVFAAGAALYVAWPLAAHGLDVAGKLASVGLTDKTSAWFAVYFCAANPLLEELLWRQTLNDGRTYPELDDLLFGGYHGLVAAAFLPIVWTVPVMAACAFAGWLWRQIHSRTGTLWLPWITHVAADVSIVAAVYWRVFKT